MEMTKNPLEVIREELCSRFNLQPEQVKFELQLNDVTKEEAKPILEAYALHDFSPYYGKKGAHTSAKDGFYWITCHYPEPKEIEFTIEAPEEADSNEE